MTSEQIREQNSYDTAKPGMFDTLVGLGAATTNLAIDQVGNAFTALVHPGAAIEHVKDTLQNLSAAMNESAAERGSEYHADDLRHSHELREGTDSQEYTMVATPIHAPSGTRVIKARVKKMNHRKA